MFKLAVVFLVLSLIAGGLGMTSVSQIARRISFILFGLFFVAFLAFLGFAYLVTEAVTHGGLLPIRAVGLA